VFGINAELSAGRMRQNLVQGINQDVIGGYPVIDVLG
jgi:hypothetical protein